MIEMVPPVVRCALDPFPVPVRTLDPETIRLSRPLANSLMRIIGSWRIFVISGKGNCSAEIRDAMHPTTDRKQTDSHHVSSSHADDEFARRQQRLLKRERDRPWLRGLIVLFIAASVGAAALVSQSSYRDAVAPWAPQLISAPSLPSAEPVAINSRARTTQAQVTAATAVAERVTAATAVAILMARPEIKTLFDLAGRNIAIDDKHSAADSNIRTAMAAMGAVEVQLSVSQTKAIDRVIGGEVPASILTLASPEAAEGFPEIAGFKIFRVPLSERETKSP
jgi:hypothetical protein